MTFDSTSTNNVYVDLLQGQQMLKEALLIAGERIRCCARILNLMIQDGLNEIDEWLESIKRMSNLERDHW